MAACSTSRNSTGSPQGKCRTGSRCEPVTWRISLDISNVKPDFLVTVGYKWLLGPYGLGYLYADAKYFNGNPIEYSWLNKKKLQGFQPGRLPQMI